VACGVGMLSEIKSFNAEKGRSADEVIQMGIGLHSGPVVLGTIGSSERMDSTVIGFTVNLAKRLEELTRPFGVDMLISIEVANRLPNGHAHQIRTLGDVFIKGSSVPLTIMEVYDQDTPEGRKLKDQTKE